MTQYSRNIDYLNKLGVILLCGKKQNGRLIQTTDESRVKFRTNISQINIRIN